VAKAKLSEYSAKRSFSATPEPPPAERAAAGGPLLFVVQQHAARRLHFDFRLECDGVLKSWAVPNGPSLDPAQKRLAVPTEDHPFDYGSFEGVIPPKQYGAGEVIVCDCGVYTPDDKQAFWYHERAEAERRVREGIDKGKLSFTLRGEKLKGSFALVRTADRKSWLLIKHKDRFVTTADVTGRNRSVLSGVTVEDLKAVPAHRIPAERLAPNGPVEALPKTLSPMHAETAEAPFNHADWMWEPKLDGYRVLAFLDHGKVTLRSRRGALDLAADFPKLCAELAQQNVDSMILDGEIVAFDAEGRPSFQAMQNRSAGNERAIFFGFDLLHFAGVNLRDSPYADRRRYLAQCLLPSPRVQLVHATEDGVALHAAALDAGFEGVIGKRKASRYEAGKRSGAWLKVKAFNSGDFVIGGYTKGKGSRAPLGSMLVGTWESRKLVFASHVGSGFDDETLPALKARLEKLQTKTCPFAEKPELHSPTTWVKPELVAEVKFQSWTEDGRLRAPVFLRLRDDVDAKSVRRAEQTPAAKVSKRANKPRDARHALIDDVVEQLKHPKAMMTLAVGAAQIKLTHLDRVYWPADPALQQPPLTKRDLLRYLAQVSPFMLPHLADRPLTMIRMPDGI
jgi:bifunctional non-homologous end joining protein LigD